MRIEFDLTGTDRKALVKAISEITGLTVSVPLDKVNTGRLTNLLELVRMDDLTVPPIGTHGTVIAVDDIGSILVDWDNGSSLSVAYGGDRCRKITK